MLVAIAVTLWELVFRGCQFALWALRGTGGMFVPLDQADERWNELIKVSRPSALRPSVFPPLPSAPSVLLSFREFHTMEIMLPSWN